MFLCNKKLNINAAPHLHLVRLLEKWFWCVRKSSGRHFCWITKTLVRDYLEYAEHIFVADEHFVGTLMRNTESL